MYNLEPLAYILGLPHVNDWNSLENRRNELSLQMLYEIIHQLVDINTDGLLPPRPHYHSTRDHSLRFLQLPTRINAYSQSFFPKSIRLWNSLSYDIVSLSDFNLFKQQVTGLNFLN